jgi:hypothetical protein
MGKLKARGKGTKARAEAKGAAKAGKAAAKDAVRGNTKRAKAESQVAALATKEAAKDAAAAIKELSTAVAEQARESDALAKAQSKGIELAELAKDKMQERGYDEKAAELVERIREADSTQQALEAARRYSAEGLGVLGAWLASGKRAEQLGVQPRKRRFPAWLAAVIGFAVGYGVAIMTKTREGEQLREGMSTAAQRITQDTRDVSAPPADRPLEDQIRTALGEDPRTADLPKLNINVAEGTVFVRGPIPEGIEESSIREVIASIPGVADVDLQLSTA